MKSRRKVGIIAKYSIKARRKQQLIDFEPELKAAGYEGVISNEASRAMPKTIKFGEGKATIDWWIILYHNTETKEKIFAYRNSPSSNRNAQVVSIPKMRKILNK